MEQQRCFKFTDYQRAELENAFKKFTPNAEGQISFENVQKLIHSIEDRKNSHLEIEGDESSGTEVTCSSFPGGANEVSFDQFIAILEESISSPQAFEKALARSFRLMDLKNNGFVDAQDLMKIGDLLGESISSQEEARRILSRAQDLGENGKLTLKSLRAFLYNDLDPTLSP